jgi:dephospho-CoA kinase
MPAIGITGGVSTGKTAFCGCLRELMPQAAFFDADIAARQLADEDPAVREEIQQEFGAGIYSSSGHLNRAEVRAIILKSAGKKRALEQILHPRIRRQWSGEAQRHHNSPDFFFADIPLLYESGGESLCDAVVVVACSPDVQLERLLARRPTEGRAASPGGTASQELRTPMSRNEALQLIDSQMPLAEKISRADHVVWNNGDRIVLARQAQALAGLWTTKSWIRN